MRHIDINIYATISMVLAEVGNANAARIGRPTSMDQVGFETFGCDEDND
jgi:hypothetical protein